MAGLKAWRLSLRKYAESAFSGEGPRIYGGRWNPVGVPVVYASLSLSLAVLEVFVHMTTRAEPDDYVSIEVDLGIDESQAERVDLRKLPRNWRMLENPTLQAMGAEWAQSKRSLVLLVPSVIIEGEWNAVVNPLHPSAKKIALSKPKSFTFDERLFKEW